MATRETGAVVLDAAGNTTAMSRRDSVGNLVDFTFTYNHGGRRMSTTGVHDLTDPQTSQARDISATYTYNPLGQRIFKAVQVIDQPGTPQAAYNWASNRFHYGPEGHLLADVESLDNGTSVTDTTRQWIYLNGVPIAQVTDAEDANGNPLPSRLTWFYSDHLGVARAGMNASEDIIWQIETMTGFGDDIQIQSVADNGITLVNPLRFPGQYSDAETGLSYNYFRDYEPGLGRYVQSDPIGLDGGLNTYAYVSNNPVNDFDPRGLNQMNRSSYAPGGSNNHNKNAGKVPECWNRCMNSLGPPLQTTSASSTISALVLLQEAKSANPTVLAYCAAAYTGWGLGTTIGCGLSCGLDHESW